MTENWKSIEGYEGLYAVSDLGNVMSMDYKGSGLPGLLKPLNGTKYPRVCLCKDGMEEHRYIHALVMYSFVGPRPEGMQINHKDGNKRNRALTNLEYCTSAENNRHAIATGLREMPKCAKHWRVKLTDSKVLEIRAYLAAGVRFLWEF